MFLKYNYGKMLKSDCRELESIGNERNTKKAIISTRIIKSSMNFIVGVVFKII